jgi:hypothetical protein
LYPPNELPHFRDGGPCCFGPFLLSAEGRSSPSRRDLPRHPPLTYSFVSRSELEDRLTQDDAARGCGRRVLAAHARCEAGRAARRLETRRTVARRHARQGTGGGVAVGVHELGRREGGVMVSCRVVAHRAERMPQQCGFRRQEDVLRLQYSCGGVIHAVSMRWRSVRRERGRRAAGRAWDGR